MDARSLQGFLHHRRIIGGYLVRHPVFQFGDADVLQLHPLAGQVGKSKFLRSFPVKRFNGVQEQIVQLLGSVDGHPVQISAAVIMAVRVVPAHLTADRTFDQLVGQVITLQLLQTAV